MVQRHLLNLYPARTAGMLSGARRGAMMLLATLVLTLTAQTAWAESVDLSTVTENKVLQNNDVVTGTLGANVRISIADGATVTLNGMTINGVNDNSYTWAGITCEGDAIIILADGSENSVKGFGFRYPGIYVPQNKTLTIRGGAAGTGKLNASAYQRGAGIGGGADSGGSCGNIVIEGGIITASGGDSSAGIGSGNLSHCGNITITGGTVTATGSSNYPGIGSGNSRSCGDITISGTANVTASTAGGSSAGIGSGYCNSSCGNITISTTGTVTATGGSGAAGIGSGKGWYNDADGKNNPSTCGNILITAGTVTASGGSHGAGIGSSDIGSCGTIEIQGGTVTATGGQYAAGIGSGFTASENIFRCKTITISGGTVIATGGENAAGIGTGYANVCGSISITDGVTSVTAIKGAGSQNHIGLGADYDVLHAYSAILDKDGEDNDVAGTITIGNLLYDETSGNTRTLCSGNIVSLADNADNMAALDDAHNKFSIVTLNGRTLYKDGDWNTLCLPFAVTDFTGSPLEGATVKELLTTSNLDNTGKLTLNFSDDLTAIEAGKPYIVKWVPDITSTPIIDPADEVVTALNFISELPTVDGGQTSNWGTPQKSENYDMLVDGNTSTKYGLSNNDPWVEFHYASAIIPKGYALWTEDSEGTRNPRSWTIKAKVNPGDAWTTLVTVDNSNGDKLPMANNTRTVFALNNTTAYQYFRFEATRINSGSNSGQFQLAELQFCTVQPTISVSVPDIVNPVFKGVTIDKAAPAPVEFSIVGSSDKCQFVGNYAPLEITNANRNSIVLLAAGNKLGYAKTDRTLGAFHAYFNIPGSAAVRGFELNFGEDESTTGIISTTDCTDYTDKAGAIYDLQGRRVENPKKGLYIVNGKKLVIK